MPTDQTPRQPLATGGGEKHEAGKPLRRKQMTKLQLVSLVLVLSFMTLLLLHFAGLFDLPSPG